MIDYIKREGGVHGHTRISRVTVETTSICYVVRKYLCGSVPISVSEVRLIRRPLADVALN
jgi:hypothetical protein